MRFAAIGVFTLWSAASIVSGAGPALDPVLHAIEDRYNHAKSLKLDFSESFAVSRRPTQNESGVLYLQKPGKMLWEYSTPAGKQFLADGKDTWLYDPDQHQVEKRSLKMSEDMRAPLAFLLGKLDFQKDFQSFTSRKEGNDTWLAAAPKTQNLPYTEVEFLADRDGRIRKVRVTGIDQSKLEFSFSNEQLNAPVAANLFVFHPPIGAAIVEAQQ